MEELNSTVNNGQQQSAVETVPIISSLTAVAPISASDVDFPTDSKWEFTPLEKASLDCIEVDTQAFSSGNGDQQQEHVKDDRNKSELASDAKVSKPNEQKQQAKEQHALIENSEPQHATLMDLNASDIIETGTKDKKSTNTSNDEDLKTDDQEEKMDQAANMADQVIISRELTEIEDTSTISNIFSKNSAETPVNAEPNKAIGPTNRNVDHNKQNDDEKRSYLAKDDTPQPTQGANFLSQGSQMDAHMERLIDNVVELGGGHNFEQDFGHSADKAKVVESIHREITSDRSSMEIMADIALQQLPLDTAPQTTAQTSVLTSIDDKKPEENIIPVKTDAAINDLNDSRSHDCKDEFQETARSEDEGANQSDDSPKESKEQKESPFKHDTADQIMESEGVGDIVETFVEEASSTTSLPTLGEVEPTIEEPSLVEVEASAQEHGLNSDILVEPVDKVGENVREVDLVPVIEEAPSAEDSDGTEKEKEKGASSLKKSKVEFASISEAIEKTDESHQEAVPEEQTSKLDTSRRRSGRSRAKPEEKPTESTPTVETCGRTQTRGRNSVKKVTGTPVHNETSMSVEVDKARNAQDETPTKEPSGLAPATNEMELEKDDSESKKIDEVSTTTRARRTRAPQKPVEEAPQLQEEPAKRQTKRSRSSLDSELNKSLETSKNTPLIKLPTQRSRATISTSNPSTRPPPEPAQKRKRSPSPDVEASFSSTDKKYTCCECNFSTDRLNNLVFHYNKGFCLGKCQMVEVMKADIIKQQQTPKGNKNKRFAR